MKGHLSWTEGQSDKRLCQKRCSAHPVMKPMPWPDMDMTNVPRSKHPAIDPTYKSHWQTILICIWFTNTFARKQHSISEECTFEKTLQIGIDCLFHSTVLQRVLQLWEAIMAKTSDWSALKRHSMPLDLMYIVCYQWRSEFIVRSIYHALRYSTNMQTTAKGLFCNQPPEPLESFQLRLDLCMTSNKTRPIPPGCHTIQWKATSWESNKGISCISFTA